MLKEKYGRAKALGERVNASRGKINALKATIEQRRTMQSMARGLSRTCVGGFHFRAARIPTESTRIRPATKSVRIQKPHPSQEQALYRRRIDVLSPRLYMFIHTLQVSHALISVECLFSMTLLPGGGGGRSRRGGGAGEDRD